jgi:hypothetical protein
MQLRALKDVGTRDAPLLPASPPREKPLSTRTDVSAQRIFDALVDECALPTRASSPSAKAQPSEKPTSPVEGKEPAKAFGRVDSVSEGAGLVNSPLIRDAALPAVPHFHRTPLEPGGHSANEGNGQAGSGEPSGPAPVGQKELLPSTGVWAAWAELEQRIRSINGELAQRGAQQPAGAAVREGAAQTGREQGAALEGGAVRAAVAVSAQGGGMAGGAVWQPQEAGTEKRAVAQVAEEPYSRTIWESTAESIDGDGRAGGHVSRLGGSGRPPDHHEAVGGLSGEEREAVPPIGSFRPLMGGPVSQPQLKCVSPKSRPLPPLASSAVPGVQDSPPVGPSPASVVTLLPGGPNRPSPPHPVAQLANPLGVQVALPPNPSDNSPSGRPQAPQNSDPFSPGLQKSSTRLGLADWPISTTTESVSIDRIVPPHGDRDCKSAVPVEVVTERGWKDAGGAALLAAVVEADLLELENGREQGGARLEERGDGQGGAGLNQGELQMQGDEADKVRVLRFDPTVGDAGAFYYVDVRNEEGESGAREEKQTNTERQREATMRFASSESVMPGNGEVHERMNRARAGEGPVDEVLRAATTTVPVEARRLEDTTGEQSGSEGHGNRDKEQPGNGTDAVDPHLRQPASSAQRASTVKDVPRDRSRSPERGSRRSIRGRGGQGRPRWVSGMLYDSSLLELVEELEIERDQGGERKTEEDGPAEPTRSGHAERGEGSMAARRAGPFVKGRGNRHVKGRLGRHEHFHHARVEPEVLVLSNGWGES